MNVKWRIITTAIVAVVALIMIYPTVRWNMYSRDTQKQLGERWFQERGEAARTGGWARMSQSFREWAQGHRDWTVNLGLDLRGGIMLRYQVVMPEDWEAPPGAEGEGEGEGAGPDQSSERRTLDQIVEITLSVIRNRIDTLGLTEPVVQREGDDFITLQLPGVEDISSALEIVGKVGKLTFHEVVPWTETLRVLGQIEQGLSESNKLNKLLKIDNPPLVSIRFRPQDLLIVQKSLDEARDKGLVPEEYLLLHDAGELEDGIPTRRIYLIYKREEVSGERITSSNARIDNQGLGGWIVTLNFDGEGAVQFADLTGRLAPDQGQTAIVLDGVVQSAPYAKSRITGGRAQIEGSFTLKEANNLSIVLQSGALPATLVNIQNETVGPTLGKQSIQQGLTSMIIGFVLVVVFVVIYYRLSGVIAVIALALNSIVILAALAMFNATLTLPGIAGIILTIGMAVDANVLILERVREEILKGKTLRSAIDTGYARAFLTILDAQITTLITALFLFWFGTGPIKGFAVTLSIGILSSLFTSIFVTRTIYEFLLGRRMLQKIQMLRMIKDTQIPFIKWRFPAMATSVVLIIIGIGWFVARGEKNFGVEFSEGTQAQVTFRDPVTTSEVRSAISTIGLETAVIQEMSSPNKVLIRFGNKGDDPSSQIPVEMLLGALAQEIIDNPVAEDESRFSMIGRQVAADLRTKAGRAILLSLVGIFVYVMIRFEPVFAVGGVVALIHDAMITLGILAFTGKEITLAVVAALLTIVGYSINDTIVVYDRIREDLQLYRGKPRKDVINQAINETLPRTVLTSLTSLIVMAAIMAYGGPVIHDFAFTLFIGIIVGTYSSIFIASPVLLLFEKKKTARK